jgi:hypothetical protein
VTPKTRRDARRDARQDARPNARPQAHRDQPRIQTNYPGSTIFLGLVFVGLGALMFFVLADRAKPGYVLAAQLLAANFVLMGALLAGAAVAGMQKRRAAERAGGSAAWRYDYAWDHKGASDETFKRGLRVLRACALLIFFLLPFHLIFATVESSERWFLYAVLAVFDAVILIVFIRGAILLLKRRKFGSRRVHFDRFPYTTGSPLHLTFDGGHALANTKVELRLQSIREIWERSSAGRGSKSFVAELLHDDVQVVTTDERGSAVVRFPVPAGCEGTDLVGPIPRYWELVASASVPGLDYEGIFLLPVYTAR